MIAAVSATCFVIMPVTTPADRVSHYGGDPDHFQHVYDHLFLPVLNKLDYTVIAPITEGSQLIQADIIAALSSADLVLCDMSSLNANVFFELGIRTALNKPVCVVRDSLTDSIPFDMSIVSAHKYDAALSVWTLEPEKLRLAQHIEATVRKGGDRNSMWQRFGLTTTAELQTAETDLESKVNLLLELASGASARASERRIDVLDDEALATQDQVYRLADGLLTSGLREIRRHGRMAQFIVASAEKVKLGDVEEVTTAARLMGIPIEIMDTRGNMVVKQG